ncbi:hypothetical protein [Dactylosporangium sp. CA-139066]|uniref:hypothetical protein n=1 Tax=Dactylosporangium sp. CA-139066 TaxID=3239930 RepID=UPI003D8A6B2A
MSDSPLDGGSGWPTSAYAIVPRQPAGPQDAPAGSPQPPPPPAQPPDEDLQAVPPASRKGRVAVLVVGLIVLVIAAVGGVLATRTNAGSTKDDTDAKAATTTAPEPTTGEPAVAVGDPSAGGSGGAGAGASAPAGAAVAGGSASASALASGSAEATAPAAPPSTTILRTGTAQLAVLAGKPDDAYDFDSGMKQTAGADATASALGISAANGAKFAVLLGGDTPSLAACSAIPAEQWTGQVLLAGLVPGSKVCVRTSEQRYAWFMTRAGEVVNGALYTANLDYIVYKKPGE